MNERDPVQRMRSTLGCAVVLAALALVVALAALSRTF